MSSWLKIDPIQSTTEVDDRLQLQNLERSSKKMDDTGNFTYPNEFTDLNTSQLYHDRRCSEDALYSVCCVEKIKTRVNKSHHSC